MPIDGDPWRKKIKKYQVILLIKLLIVDEPVINVIFEHTKPKNEIAIIDGKIQNLLQNKLLKNEFMILVLTTAQIYLNWFTFREKDDTYRVNQNFKKVNENYTAERLGFIKNVINIVKPGMLSSSIEMKIAFYYALILTKI